jgi:hypothetical protein
MFVFSEILNFQKCVVLYGAGVDSVIIPVYGSVLLLQAHYVTDKITALTLVSQGSCLFCFFTFECCILLRIYLTGSL